ARLTEDGRRLARGQVVAEEALVYDHRALGGHALVVVAEGAEAARHGRVGDDRDVRRAVAEGAAFLGRDEARARLASLQAELASQYDSMASRLVYLEGGLG